METLPVNGRGNKHRDRLLQEAVQLVAILDQKMGYRYAWQQSWHNRARDFLDGYALRTPTDAEAAVTRVQMLLDNCGPLVAVAQVRDTLDPEGSWRFDPR